MRVFARAGRLTDAEKVLAKKPLTKKYASNQQTLRALDHALLAGVGHCLEWASPVQYCAPLLEHERRYWTPHTAMGLSSVCMVAGVECQRASIEDTSSKRRRLELPRSKTAKHCLFTCTDRGPKNTPALYYAVAHPDGPHVRGAITWNMFHDTWKDCRSPRKRALERGAGHDSCP